MTCPCGCPRPVPVGNRYATQGCAGRVRLRSMPDRCRRLAAIKSADARRGKRILGILARVDRGELTVRQGLNHAYWSGYGASKHAKTRQRKVAAGAR